MAWFGQAIGVLGLLVASIPTSDGGRGEGSSVPVALREGWQMVAPVTVGGRGPYRFLVDTGASHSAIAERLAQRLGAPAVARALVTTPLGDRPRVVVRLAEVAVGSVRVAELLPTVVATERDRDEVWAGIDGILGQDFLGQFDHTLDYQGRRLRIGAPQASSGGGTRLPVVHLEGRPLVRLAQPRGQALTLVPDSGASALVLFGDVRLATVPSLANARVDTLAGSTDRPLLRLLELRAGQVVLRNLLAVVLERRDRRAAEGDGLLPLHLFASVSFTRGGEMTVAAR